MKVISRLGMTKEFGLEGERPGLVEKRNSQANLKVMIWGSFTRGVFILRRRGDYDVCRGKHNCRKLKYRTINLLFE